MQRYFSNVDNNFIVHLTPNDEHHILHVMRMKKGDEIEVVSDGKVFLCRVDSVNPLMVSAIHEIENDVELKEDVTLLFALAKGVEHCMGYAGGLGPDNIVDNLDKINVVANINTIWVDAEGKLKTDKKFDVALAKRYVLNVKDWVNKQR